ncbi:MAG: NAD(P)H-binding protein [Ferrovibrio sp.]|uniref:NmrA family NAD(P)-binding protein n=1 Tax=Ferrovibrio sp. TaxID=1917215 RepID=UPI00262E017E|nr:NAD(P)H-binding protein [Ferrovibrio sp.]MCW0234765.1 NAD(P)H-binding protein [Ferrovibrio sp.]
MIVVTAPTSQIGRKIVDDLLATDASLRLVVRDVAKLPGAIRHRVEVIEGSHGDPSIVDRAFSRASAVFWLVPADMTKSLDAAWLDFTRPAAAALRSNAVPRVVSVTALGRGTPWQDKAGPVTASIRADDMLMASGAAFRGIAMPSFMENVARQAGVIREKGMFFGPINPDRELPFTATRDIAVVAARLLGDDRWTGQEDVPLLGPEDLSFRDQAEIMSDVIGRRICYQQISYEQFRQQFLDRGASESFAQGYVDMYRAKEEGIDSLARRNPQSTGRTSFRAFCQDVLRPLIAS